MTNSIEEKTLLGRRIVKALEEAYPEAVCSLNFSEPWQLLFATRLAAQCTDARVNMVTPELYSRYPTVKDLAEAREVVANSFELKHYEPTSDRAAWDAAYERFCKLI